MSHTVESCPLTKLNGGLSRLHSADEDAVSWLTSYGKWHAYEKNIQLTHYITGRKRVNHNKPTINIINWNVNVITIYIYIYIYIYYKIVHKVHNKKKMKCSPSSKLVTRHSVSVFTPNIHNTLNEHIHKCYPISSTQKITFITQTMPKDAYNWQIAITWNVCRTWLQQLTLNVFSRYTNRHLLHFLSIRHNLEFQTNNNNNNERFTQGHEVHHGSHSTSRNNFPDSAYVRKYSPTISDATSMVLGNF